MGQMRTADRRAVESRVVERRWRGLVAAWKRSGHDERVFCRREKLGLCAFRWWVRHFDMKKSSATLEPTSPLVDATPSGGAQPPYSGRRSLGEQNWAELSVQWEQSGLRQSEFCRQHGLSVQTFRWWRWRLGSGKAGRPLASRMPAAPTPTAMATFVPVEVIAAPKRPRRARQPTMDVVLRRRRRVRVSADFDARFLARVVSVLEALP
jgi:hypothetical protein